VKILLFCIYFMTHLICASPAKIKAAEPHIQYVSSTEQGTKYPRITVDPVLSCCTVPSVLFAQAFNLRYRLAVPLQVELSLLRTPSSTSFFPVNFRGSDQPYMMSLGQRGRCSARPEALLFFVHFATLAR
jgi:hypothetical protein